MSELPRPENAVQLNLPHWKFAGSTGCTGVSIGSLTEDTTSGVCAFFLQFLHMRNTGNYKRVSVPLLQCQTVE